MQVQISNGKTVEISADEAQAVREAVKVVDGEVVFTVKGLKATIATEGLLALFSGNVAAAETLGHFEDVVDSFVAIRSQI